MRCARITFSALALAALTVAQVAPANDTADRYFIDRIFKKYGDKGVISFEGFEHLLESLGLGGSLWTTRHDLELHRVNGTFRALHDIQHRHPRSVSTQVETPSSILKAKSCLSPQELLEVYGLEEEPGVISIGPDTFMEICPALVYQLDQRSCFRQEAAPQQVDRRWGWIYASVSILIISATGLLGVAIVPLLKSAIFSYVLQFLVAIAVGTLCGDALLHLMPHAMHSNATTAGAREMDTIYKCSVTFLTILLFYSLEALMQMIHGGHSHDMPPQQPSEECKAGDRPDQPQPGGKIELGAMLPDSPPPLEKLPQALTSTALMVILGDGLHNLTDGLAIGAAFSGDPVTGFATALAVFCHELPHELGDFAVLLRSGMSIRRALYYNLLSSFLSFMGMAIGLWLAEDHESASQWIYAATAGSFLYIGLADLVPEINSNSKGKLLNFFLASTGILAGGVIMFFIAINEDALASLFKSFDT